MMLSVCIHMVVSTFEKCKLCSHLFHIVEQLCFLLGIFEIPQMSVKSGRRLHLAVPTLAAFQDLKKKTPVASILVRQGAMLR